MAATAADRDRGPPARGRDARRAGRGRSRGAARARSRRCRRSTSTTSAARSCSSAITELPEYYPTRVERSILEREAPRDRRRGREPTTLIELGSGRRGEDALAARRDARRRHARDLRPGRHLRGDHPPGRRRAGRRVRGAARPRRRLRLRDPSRARPARGGRADRVPRRHDRQLPARPAALVPGPDRDADVPGRPLPARHRPGQGHGGPRGRLQRLAPGSRPSSTRTCSTSSTASSTPTSTPTTSSTSPSSTPRTSGSTSACARSPSSSSTCAGSTCAPTSPATRRCAPRSRPSSPASGSRPATPTPGSSWSSGGPTRTSSTRSASREPAG